MAVQQIQGEPFNESCRKEETPAPPIPKTDNNGGGNLVDGKDEENTMNDKPEQNQSNNKDEDNKTNDEDEDNKIILEQNTWERYYIHRQRTIVKRHAKQSEVLIRDDGTVVYPYWAHERLRNDAATLLFIAENTTIPVPKGRLYMEDGVLHLETTRITGGILLEELEEGLKQAAHAAVDKQLQTDILPQLRSIRRNSIGPVDLDLPVLVPPRIHRLDRRAWERITSDTDEFVLCHNDLSKANIFVDPDDNFRIVGIIDWEYAGFFPSYFELPVWKCVDGLAIYECFEEALVRDLAFFGMKTEDLQNTSGDLPPIGQWRGTA
ncbi:hypothetical protein FQN57_002581 [Myotisia sp. PD_48]|nr:hypothetical protein FQN57_002581 [Myotisia sp. PD_48]